MIDERRFSDERTLRLFYGERVRRYPPDLVQRTQKQTQDRLCSQQTGGSGGAAGQQVGVAEKVIGAVSGVFESMTSGASALPGTVRELWRSKSWIITEWV